MDIGKILLIYMSLSLANAIGTGELPENQLPDSTEPVSVAETVSDDQMPAPVGKDENLFPSTLPVPQSEGQGDSAVSAQSPKPSVKINKGYTLVRYKDRGANVRKLQGRLIELGYLSEGADDGVFGNKTLEAVKEFQKANGLTRDGVAGDTTLTYLYDYDDVVAKKTPEPPEAATAAPANDANSSSEEFLPELEQPRSELSELSPMENSKVVIKNAAEPLNVHIQADGVTQSTPVHLWKSSNVMYISLNDLADSVEGWNLKESDGKFTFTAGTKVIEIGHSESGYSCTVDGENVEIAPGQVLSNNGRICIALDALKKTAVKDYIWDEDEQTLILDV